MTVASKSECEAIADLPLNCITSNGHQEAIPLVAKQSSYTVVYEKVCSLDILKQFFLAVYGIWSPVHSSELNKCPLIHRYCMHWAWPQSISLSHPSLSPKSLVTKQSRVVIVMGRKHPSSSQDFRKGVIKPCILTMHNQQYPTKCPYVFWF